MIFAKRIRVLAGVLVAVVTMLAARLYLLQVVRADDFAARADRQYARPAEGVFDRGDIFFTDKNGAKVRAATVESGFTLAIVPAEIADPSAALAALSRIVPLNEGDFLARAGKVDDPYEEIAHRLSQEQADAIVAAGVRGVRLSREGWRQYPGGARAAQTLGFVAFDGDDLVGRYGLERYYDDALRRAGDGAYTNFFAEVFSQAGSIFSDERDGGEVVTSIEPTVQDTLERTLTGVAEHWQARSAGGVVLDPTTGDIYALAALPTFDLNAFGEVDDQRVYGNPLVESVFEMGSIIKALTMAAGLDAGVVAPDTKYTDQGFLSLDNGAARIANYDGRGRGRVDMQRVLGESLNTGAAFVESRLGNARFAEYFRAFGLGEETGIDLPGEVRGLLDNLDSPRDVEYATASFGQGIALTPIATVRALAALGNGGMLVTPHIASRIEYELGPAKKIFYEPRGRVISPEASEEITRMLVTVVDDYLLGGDAELEHHSVAAKTGTAQIASPAGGYYDDRYFHSFFGYFPAFAPRFLVFLYVNEPRGVRYASETLGHPFLDIAKFLISYYEVPPDR